MCNLNVKLLGQHDLIHDLYIGKIWNRAKEQRFQFLAREKSKVGAILLLLKD